MFLLVLAVIVHDEVRRRPARRAKLGNLSRVPRRQPSRWVWLRIEPLNFDCSVAATVVGIGLAALLLMSSAVVVVRGFLASLLVLASVTAFGGGGARTAAGGDAPAPSTLERNL